MSQRDYRLVLCDNIQSVLAERQAAHHRSFNAAIVDITITVGDLRAALAEADSHVDIASALQAITRVEANLDHLGPHADRHLRTAERAVVDLRASFFLGERGVRGGTRRPSAP